MDDNDKPKSSWDDLLEDLGAQPDEAAFERKQPTSQDIPPTLDWEAAVELAETVGAPSDWGGLAASLGLEVPEEEQPKTEQSEAAVEEPPRLESPAFEENFDSEEDAEEEAEQAADEQSSAPQPFGGFLAPEPEPEADEPEEVAEESEPETLEAEASDDQLEGRDDSSEPDELPPLPSSMDQALSESAFDDASEGDESDSSADVDANGISGEAARSAFDALFADGASTWGSAFLDKPKRESLPAVDKDRFGDDDEISKRADALDATSESGSDSDDDEEEQDKPKRKRSRRRRRGGRGRKSSDEQTVDSEANADGQDDPTVEREEDEESSKPKRRRRRRSRSSDKRSDDAVDSDDSLEDDLEDSELGDGETPRRGRQRHRNIPTWSEAIGMIVDSNLEQRSKSPSKPQSSRGGRGRGGRRRGGRKSEGNNNK